MNDNILDNWNSISCASQELGDAFYFFDEARFCSNYHEMLGEFARFYPRVEIAYSYKTNYTPYICKLVDRLGGRAEVVSEMELELARRVGVDFGKVIYNGPCKSYSSLDAAARAGVLINLDNLEDIKKLEIICAQTEMPTVQVAFRCNFGEIDGQSSRFGFDVGGEEFEKALKIISKNKRLDLVGLHCHYPNRQPSTYKTRALKVVALANRIFSNPPKFINLGGGFMSHMPADLANKMGVVPASFCDYAQIIGNELIRHYGDKDDLPTLIVEPGTALVADTLNFVCQVTSTRYVGERLIAVVSGSIFNISPTARSSNLPVTLVCNPQNLRDSELVFDVAGYTCIESDFLSRNVRGNPMVGDFLVYSNVGSYSVVMKPPFILPSVPIVMCGKNGLEVIKQGEDFDYIFEKFKF
ncbi:diaminopimelate decarboxylase [Oryzomicrobium terrae]|uniref:Diaminopimelate decarboxylase n=1 Tax=Oryzomicrobium terrae TaxID=1735038 RepID=A0A5C1ECM2_9RHOO|nr:hypothetical protein [Oryzomicrobium terrae]QEL66028.1 diaminopimelate decarboxylase [Oryzomicrobium terrae]